MDPSLSISSDPHHPPQFTPFPPFPSSNPFISGAVPAPNHHPFGGPNPYMNNNHVFQPQPQTQTQTQIPQPPMMQPSPHPTHPPYSEMICAAIAALNEPDGSSKMAISRYMERCHTGLPAAHGALLTHHLKTLKNSGVLAMVKKSYKFAASSTTPESVAVAAAAAAAAQGLDVPRSEILPPTNTVNDPIAASQPQKRGRGRPPKPKPEASQQQQPINVQSNQVQSNGQPIWEQQQVELPVAKPAEAVPVTESVKRGPGRPRKDGAASAPIVQASVMAGIMKRRGRPPGRRAAGRQRKPKSVSATVSVFPYVANGARRRGRPRRADSISTTVAAPQGGQVVAAIAPGMKRGRGRPPKVGGVSVMSRLIKPKRGRGRPVGRPRKIATSVTTGTQDSGELKRKFDIFQEKVKEIVNVLKAGVTSENQAVMQAIKDLEGLAVTQTETETTVEPQAMEEVQPEETAEPLAGAQAEAAETHGGQEQEQGQEREGGEAQAQTEAEAMQEALF